MPTVAKLAQGAKGLKVKELPSYVSKFAQTHWTPAQTQQRVTTWLNDYKVKHIDSGSVKPLFDLVSYGFLVSYAISWPREYAHYKHEQEAKLKGGAAH